jgi:hypothetical protein
MNTSVMTQPDKLPNEVLQLIMGAMLRRQQQAATPAYSSAVTDVSASSNCPDKLFFL